MNTYLHKSFAILEDIAIRPAPVAAVVAAAAVLAWRTHGSLAAPDWLPAAVFAALVATTVAAAGVARRPPRLLAAGTAGLASLAAWTAASIAWAPSPAGARDEALLVALYAVALIVPGLALAGERQRIAALGWSVLILGVLDLATAVELTFAHRPLTHFFDGRLDAPVTYVNASSAFAAIGVWPALVLASRREGAAAGRAAALGAAGLMAALAVAAQSKGTIVGFALSALLVFVLTPLRLRLLSPLVLAAAPAAVGAVALTAPYRNATTAAAHGVGAAAVTAGAASLLLGLAYVWVDHRIELGERTRSFVGRTLLALIVAGVAIAVAAFALTVASPGSWVSQKWTAFKHPETSGGATHLSSLGSNRYDFWRVALDEAGMHPLLGVGGRGFYSVYLQHRRSGESPLRSHSLYLDTVAEEGVPGLMLLLLGVGAPLILVARRLSRPSAVAGFGAAVYFFAHAGVDWIWTIPAVGVPAVVLLGIAAAGDTDELVRRGVSLLLAGAALTLAMFAFAPPWLAYRYVAAAYRSTSPAVDLARARDLDPLSLEPDWAEWRFATTPAGRVAALERAREQEPDSIAVLYHLGIDYIRAGNRAAALRLLRRAHRLDPRDRAVRTALVRAAH